MPRKEAERTPQTERAVVLSDYLGMRKKPEKRSTAHIAENTR